jgi:hypothetical protein
MEKEIETRFDRMHRDPVVELTHWTEAAILVAQVEVKIFQFSGPPGVDQVFEAGADGPPVKAPLSWLIPSLKSATLTPPVENAKPPFA